MDRYRPFRNRPDLTRAKKTIEQPLSQLEDRPYERLAFSESLEGVMDI
jgi:hypothetical protein